MLSNSAEVVGFLLNRGFCLARFARRGLLGGFLGGFAEDDSFLNHSHFASEYFTEDSLNRGFQRRFATRHSPLIPFLAERGVKVVFSGGVLPGG
jgi:hypothetical protein